MTINEIMVIFKNPDTIHTLSPGDKILGVGFTMILGMSITLVSLLILKLIMETMAKVLVEKEKPQAAVSTAREEVLEPVETTEEVVAEDQAAVIAAITVALSMKLKTPMSNIIIRDIKKVNNNHHTWSNVGVVEQMNSRL